MVQLLIKADKIVAEKMEEGIVEQTNLSAERQWLRRLKKTKDKGI